MPGGAAEPYSDDVFCSLLFGASPKPAAPVGPVTPQETAGFSFCPDFMGRICANCEANLQNVRLHLAVDYAKMYKKNHLHILPRQFSASHIREMRETK
jgi:hypothetical protein